MDSSSVSALSDSGNDEIVPNGFVLLLQYLLIYVNVHR